MTTGGGAIGCCATVRARPPTNSPRSAPRNRPPRATDAQSELLKRLTSWDDGADRSNQPCLARMQHEKSVRALLFGRPPSLDADKKKRTAAKQ